MLGDDDDEVEHVDVDENDENVGEYSNEGETPHTGFCISARRCPLW